MLHKGKEAERQASRYLQQQGLTHVAQNVQCRFGELDLIMRQGDTLVFVEVKYRRAGGFGGAIAAVTPQKQQKLRLTANWYLQQQGLSQSPCRFDVLAIDGDTINWIQNAF
ncbi:YraN family protein [Ferrimonas balearica]|uniref:YraN family protein n=1 Tax=Ferrimonas balearica TaxID=44012 RepID=UPI001C9994CC|nr:YraN family protein [Ferrimonas balearica]MBY5923212.1 YraN family protein [Ferrimonas balearica]MBY5997412.1 YraN family protein [Ferrimonas balearica]